MDKFVTILNKYWHILALIGLLATSFVHMHTDFKLMQYIQARHEEQIKELQHNLSVTLDIIANHVNKGN